MFVGAAGPVRAANSAKGGRWGAGHKGCGHGRVHGLWRNPLEGHGLRRVEASEGHSYGVSMRGGRCQHSVECLDRSSSRREIGCKIEVQCKDGVRDDGVASLIIAAGERRGSLGVGFENMMRS
jgi:hypothetical protein